MSGDTPAPKSAETREEEDDLKLGAESVALAQWNSARQTAIGDLEWLESAVARALQSARAGSPRLRGCASELGQTARAAVDSMMRSDIARAVVDGVRLAEEASP